MRIPELIVSRHTAAVTFIAESIGGVANVARDAILVATDPPIRIPVLASAVADDVRGKRVAGNLPLHLAALCSEVIAVEFDGAPPRGQEYTADDMRAAGARLAGYVVSVSDGPPVG